MTEVTTQPIPKKLSKVSHVAYFLGCDPEFFFKVDKKIVGAELFIPKEGLLNTVKSVNDRCVLQGSKTKFIIDGVQVELNPRPNTCRANLANEIAAAFKCLKQELAKKNQAIEVDFTQSVKITKKELDKLDANNQKFGCMPSKNSYIADELETKITAVDPLKYRNRSAGGHIHIGTSSFPSFKKKLEEAPDEIVQMLDIIVGNTCVLVDRDKGNKIRRKLYGRAGEYRLPPHGLEYRTLSNFWLTHYYLMSLAFGLTRFAINLATHSTKGKENIEAFKSKVDMKDIQKAINNNSFTLAYKNFKAIEPLLLETLPDYGDSVGLSTNLMKEFHYFVGTVKKNGLTHWFKEDPMTSWTNLPECHPIGFHNFLNTDVRKALDKHNKELVTVKAPVPVPTQEPIPF